MQDTKKERRKVRCGEVISNKMNKTVVVSVKRKIRHPKYEKIVSLKKKYYAHHENEGFQIGDQVEITETRPLSKLKRWRVSRLIERNENMTASAKE